MISQITKNSTAAYFVVAMFLAVSALAQTEPPNLICGANKEAECGTDWDFDIPTMVDRCGGFVLNLDPAQEPGGSGGTGAGSGTVTRSGTILTINLSFLGLSSNSTVAHIHGPAGRGTNAAVLYPLTLIPPGTTAGAINQTVTLVDGTGGFTIAQQLEQLERGLWYINIHSTAHPGGEIRGQLDAKVVIEVVSTETNFPQQECPGIFSVTRTWKATDACGNISLCNQTVTVNDTTPPNLICRANKEVECGSDWEFDKPTAVDLCDVDDVVIEVVKTETNFPQHECPGIFSVTRTWRATDICGNSSLCNQTVTVSDTTPPNLICGANKEVECGTDWDFDKPTAVDLCDVDHVVIEVVKTETNFPQHECPGIFSVTRTWKATDICGNTSLCNQTVTVSDTTPPNLICGANKEVECGSDWDFDKPTAVDLCDVDDVEIEVVKTETNFPQHECPGIFSVTRTWRATDICGNSSLCNQTVTVSDTTPPNLICGANKEVECGTDWDFDKPTAVDLCDVDDVVIEVVKTETNFPQHECPGIFSVTRTWRATDICGNRSFCNQTVTVSDTTPPNLICGANKEVECGTDWEFDKPTAVDLCDVDHVVIEVVRTETNFPQHECPGIFSVTRTWKATDICGNSSFCNQTVTVSDTTPPNLICGANKEVECGTDWDFDKPTAVDLCDVDDVEIEVVKTETNFPQHECPGIFSVTRTWKATDICGNSSFCNQTVTVSDTTPPNLICAANKEVECGTDWYFDKPTAVDLCDVDDVEIEIVKTETNFPQDECPGIFSVTRTWRATDICGNRSFCNQTVTVSDTTPPNLICGANKEVECGTDWDFDKPTAVDLCDVDHVEIEVVRTETNFPHNECPGIFSVTRTWKVTDICGNSSFCNQTVTVSDTTPPNLICGANKEVECGSDWFFDKPTAVDLCDVNDVEIEIVKTETNFPQHECPGIFSVTRTWRATDICGNRSFCNQTVTVVDTTPPNLICGANKEVECGSDWDFDKPTAVDLCDVDDVEIEVVRTETNFPQNECPGIFSVTRTWRATDICGNRSFCNQTVTVSDTTPPNLICRANKEVECGSDWFFDKPTAVDLCDVDDVEIEVVRTETNFPQDECPGIFSVTRTWRATDICGNRSFCNQTVTVVDTTPPNLICRANKEVECGSDWDFDMPTAVDLCDVDDVEIEVVRTETNLPVLQCPGIFSVTRTWKATDICGNQSFCNQTVTVVDTTPPNLICGANKEVECGTGWSFDIPTAVDQCGGFALTLDPAQEPGGSGGTGVGSGMVTRSGTALTIALRYSGLSSNSTVAHIHGPAGRGVNAAVLYPLTLIPPGTNAGAINQMVVLVDGTGGFTIAQQLEQLANGLWYVNIHTAAHPGGEIRGQLDARAVIEVVSTVTNTPVRRCPGILNVTRTWRATDACKNISFCNQTVTVLDTTPPNLTCADNQIVECGNPFAFTRPTAVDLCDGTNVVIEITSTTTNAAVPRCPGMFTVRRTWRAYDTCSNETFCSQTITLVDTTPPNLTCADDQIVECGNPFAFTRPTAMDICDGTNVVIEITSTTTNAAIPRCPGMFTVRRTWRAYDTCSNETFCSQTITMVDTTPPNLTCAKDQIVECGTPFDFTRPTAVDACDGTNVTIQIVSTTTNAAAPRCPNLFTVRRTWRAFDTCANETFCSQTITIVDTTPPNLICAGDRVVECSNPFAFTPPFAVDTCDGTNVTIAIVTTTTNAASPRCPELFTVRRTWRATDTCGNASLCSQTITILDTTPPALTCARDRFVECGLSWTFTAPTAADGCDGTNITIVIVNTVTNASISRCPDLFSATRTWRATDPCGNAAICSQTIEIVDTTPPELVCAGDRDVQCGFPWNFTPPFAVDICDGTNVTIAIVSTVTNGQCGRTFSATRTWRASDTCGNSVVCSQSILVRDTVSPEITCGPNRVLDCGVPWSFEPPSATDACDGTNITVQIVSTVTNLQCGLTLNATRSWRATDQCGNSSSCSQTITVRDTTLPNLACGPNQTVECGTPFAFAPPEVNDACGGTNVTVIIVSTATNAACGNTFSATRTWRATDACGNIATCSQTVNVVDTAPPTLSCSPNRVVECGTPFTFTPPTAFDSCDGTNVTIAILSTTTNAACGITFVAVRTWQAADRCGNRSQCSQTIRVVDSEPPVLAGVPGNQSFFCLGDAASLPAVTAFDLCDTNVTITFSSITNGRCPFIITRCWTAVDDCNNSVQACQSITVSAPLPVAVGPTNQTVCPGNPAVFCAAISSACPTTQQWYRDGTAIPGATNPCFTIPSVTLAHAGQYCIAVTGPCYSVTNCARLDVCMAALGDFVWNDFDQDGIQDVGEPGIAGVTVRLSDCLDHPVAFKSTDEFGGYLFTGLTAGTYKVTFDLPSGYKFSIPNVGSDALDSDADTVTGMTGCYTLAAGEINRTVDVGIYQPAALGDFVWNDIDQDGIRDAGEPGLENVEVRLTDCFDNPVASPKFTDQFGGFLFTGLKPGAYKVTFVRPAGYTFTIPNVGSDDLDSDVDTATGQTGCYTLAAGETNRTVDAGFFLIPCPPGTFNLTGSTSSSGSAGNIRPFSAGSVNARVSAFSRTTSGTWATAYLGSSASGLGVTDGSESDGSNDRNLVDNVSRFNYVLFEFSQAVVVNRAYLDGVISDSDITVWIGNFSDPFNNHLSLSDALLGSFALTEESLASSDANRWALFNGGEVSGNTLIIAATPAGSLNDQFRISRLDICTGPCAPALQLTTACVSAPALGQPITFSGSVSNSGNTTLSNLTVTHSIAGVVKTIAALAAGKATNYSGSFTPANCGSFAATITAAGMAACSGISVTANLSSTCSVPCPAPCSPALFNLTGNSDSSGSAGNIRRFSAGGVNVRVSAFSRTTSGTWATAYLGSYDQGLGVTDGSEGDGSDDRHVVDNVGRYNYVLFEFSQAVVVTRAYLDHVISDSDITVWIGSFGDPFNNHLTLSDALLSSFALTEDSLTSSDEKRWAMFNGAEVSGNTLVIAAKPGSSGSDQFKIPKLSICTAPGAIPIFIQPAGETCFLEWPASLAPGCVLESTTSLRRPVNWSLVATNPSNPFVITNSPQGRMRFYRIRMQ